MAIFQNKYRSESHRFRYWDYSAPSAYFITAVVHNREDIFGIIENNKFIPSPIGKIAHKIFLELPKGNKDIILDEFILMPNHFHCIIIIKDIEFQYPKSEISEFDEWTVTPSIDYIQELFNRGRMQSKDLFSEYENNQEPTKDEMNKFRKMRRKMIIPRLVGKLKMQVSKEINILNDTAAKKSWQDDFYDIIIRNKTEYKNIKAYIKTNPANWSKDRFSN